MIWLSLAKHLTCSSFFSCTAICFSSEATILLWVCTPPIRSPRASMSSCNSACCEVTSQIWVCIGVNLAAILLKRAWVNIECLQTEWSDALLYYSRCMFLYVYFLFRFNFMHDLQAYNFKNCCYYCVPWQAIFCYPSYLKFMYIPSQHILRQFVRFLQTVDLQLSPQWLRKEHPEKKEVI